MPDLIGIKLFHSSHLVWFQSYVKSSVLSCAITSNRGTESVSPPTPFYLLYSKHSDKWCRVHTCRSWPSRFSISLFQSHNLDPISFPPNRIADICRIRDHVTHLLSMIPTLGSLAGRIETGLFDRSLRERYRRAYRQ